MSCQTKMDQFHNLTLSSSLMFLASYDTRGHVCPPQLSDIEKKCLKLEYKVLFKGNLELLYPEYESKQRGGGGGGYSDRLCGGVSQPHVLEDSAVCRALAALWGAGCCCPGVFVPTL